MAGSDGTAGLLNLTLPRDTSPEVVLAKHAEAIRLLGKRVVGDVIEIGERLTECKRVAGHGHWLPWLDREYCRQIHAGR